MSGPPQRRGTHDSLAPPNNRSRHLSAETMPRDSSQALRKCGPSNQLANNPLASIFLLKHASDSLQQHLADCERNTAIAVGTAHPAVVPWQQTVMFVPFHVLIELLLVAHTCNPLRFLNVPASSRFHGFRPLEQFFLLNLLYPCKRSVLPTSNNRCQQTTRQLGYRSGSQIDSLPHNKNRTCLLRTQTN